MKKYIVTQSIWLILVVILFLCLNLYSTKMLAPYFKGFAFINTAKLAIFFLTGMALSGINGPYRKKAWRKGLPYLFYSLLLLLLILLTVAFYNYLPILIKQNLDSVWIFMSLFAGANFMHALRDRQ